MTKELSKFKSFGLSTNSLKALEKKGIEEPTPIQEKCIPLVLKNQIDVIGHAQTGTGKTLAFGLPIMELVEPLAHTTQALILVPTRELAIQVAEELTSLKGEKKVKVAAIYGGQSISLQFAKLREGVQIIVGTPGRIIDHIKRKTLDLKNIKFFVLDEADEMLNMGFIEDIEKIFNYTPASKRVLLFSATMPARILGLAKKYMPRYEHIEIKKVALTANLTNQIYFEVAESDRFEALCRIIDMEPEFYGMIFCRTKIDVDQLTTKLNDRGYSANGIHGDITQNFREKIFQKFKSKKINILVATDVAARGIDVSDLTHVVNYSLPQEPESYIHRIGRTGRAGKEGTAITFITPYEYRKLIFIARTAKTEIKKEQVPGVSEVIAMKKNKIAKEIKELLASGDYKNFEHLAKELIADNDPEQVVATLLKYSFQDELDQSRYNEIRQTSVDRTGKNRLFVAYGRQNGMTPAKLVDYITKQARIKSSLIDDVQVYDLFSFVSVPFAESELILKAFKFHQKARRPIITRAKDQKGK